jgi:alpha-glucosidase
VEQSLAQRQPSTARTPWWADVVGYQIYLPSFQDSDDDGWGDLRGVRRRLDYLQDLGVGLLWLTPFFPSPMRDHGYDVADYRSVDPRFGELSDLDGLIRSAHARGIRVIADLVVNHTSSDHPWFQRSRASRDDPYRDYYIWRPASPGGGPPNNWLSHFGGPAWALDEATDEYYLHLFTRDQPDLNWHHAAVAEEVEAIMRFWLDRGVDGFRLDVAQFLVKHPELPDNPLLGDGVQVHAGITADWLAQDHRYDLDQPATLDIHRRWREIADEYDAFLLGEIGILDPDRLAPYVAPRQLHSAFWFGLVESGWSPAALRHVLSAPGDRLAAPAWALSSHDRSRAVTRYGGGALGRERALAIAALTMGLPGIPFIYNGDELGLDDGAVLDGQGRDPLGALTALHTRDVARTPMPWTQTAGHGFTAAGLAWLPAHQRPARDTWERQRDDPCSHWASMRRLLHARAAFAARRGHRVEWLPSSAGVVAYRNGDVAVVANLADHEEPMPCELAGWTRVFDSATGALPSRLSPHRAVVLVRTPDPEQEHFE